MILDPIIYFLKALDIELRNPNLGTVGGGASDASTMCDVCGKLFASAQYMMTHKKTHETGSFLCNECGKEFDTKPKLKR